MFICARINLVPRARDLLGRGTFEIAQEFTVFRSQSQVRDQIKGGTFVTIDIYLSGLLARR